MSDKSDKTLNCCDCHQDFVFTTGEQEFYESVGFTHEPKRCKACRDVKKNAGRGGNKTYNSYKSNDSYDTNKAA